MYSILVIFLGLAAGSFLNVVIYRLHVEKNFLKGRSYCPHCKHSLGIIDLVPIFSFIFLRGKCRYCQKKISWQYPLVEISTVLIYLLLYLKFGLSKEFIVYLIYSSFLIIIFVYDLRYYLILDKVTIPAIIIAFLGGLFVLNITFFSLIWGALGAAVFFLLQLAISKGRWIGGGDIRMGFLMGVMLGWKGLIMALVLAYFIGALVGICLVVVKKKRMSSEIPFGTFLSLATVIVILYGDEIFNWYWYSLLSLT